MMHSEAVSLHNKTIDRFNQEKLYIQLTRIFLEEIKSGKWQLNQRIPSEEELCKKYGVSKITVRQAVNNLVSDGYLMKLQGKGTFPAGQRLQHPFRGIHHLRRDGGTRPGGVATTHLRGMRSAGSPGSASHPARGPPTL